MTMLATRGDQIVIFTTTLFVYVDGYITKNAMRYGRTKHFLMRAILKLLGEEVR